jgi:hypothetical protein
MTKLNRKGSAWCPNPTGKGGCKPGETRNPGGRPKWQTEARDAFKEDIPEARRILLGIMRDENAPHAARVSAANAILDRGLGKAPQSMDLNANVKNGDLAELLEEIDGKSRGLPRKEMLQ